MKHTVPFPLSHSTNLLGNEVKNRRGEKKNETFLAEYNPKQFKISFFNTQIYMRSMIKQDLNSEFFFLQRRSLSKRQRERKTEEKIIFFYNEQIVLLYCG